MKLFFSIYLCTHSGQFLRPFWLVKIQTHFQSPAKGEYIAGFQRSLQRAPLLVGSKMADEEGRKFQLIRSLMVIMILHFHVIIVTFEPRSEKDKETERKM